MGRITRLGIVSLKMWRRMGAQMLMEREWGIIVERGIEEVFDAYVDQVARIWDLGPLGALTSEPLGQGSQFRQSGDPKWGMHAPSTVISIDKYEPPTRLTWSGRADVPSSLGMQEGFSTIYNLFVRFGWGADATADAHFLPLDESRTGVVIFGRNEVTRWGAVLNPITRWFGYRWVDWRLSQFKDRTEGAERARASI